MHKPDPLPGGGRFPETSRSESAMLGTVTEA